MLVFYAMQSTIISGRFNDENEEEDEEEAEDSQICRL